MVSFTIFGNTSNVTGFVTAMDYSAQVTNQVLGYDAFGVLLLGLFFLGFYVIGSRYTQERALLFSSFMSMIVAMFLTAAHLLNPFFLLITIIGMLAAVFFINRVG